MANSHVYGLPFLRNSHLFVDFFFVLSGFVIFANYQDRLTGGFSLKRFIFLRWGRLYPLHIFILALFIGMEAAQLFIHIGGVSHHRPFSDPGQSWQYIVSSILMTHGLGFHGEQAFNSPSWSISAEFFAYILFATMLAWLKDKNAYFLGGVFLLAGVLLAAFSSQYIINSGHLAFVRCVYGFAAGAMVWRSFSRRRDSLRALMEKRAVATTLEIITALGVVVFVSLAGHGPATLLAPFVFAATVYIFAFNRGALSAVLSTKPFLTVGMISYSVYMTHELIQSLFLLGAKILGKLGFSLTVAVNGSTYLGRTLWQGDLISLVFLSAVIVCSLLTYTLLEKPCRLWSRGIAAKWE
jgi:peptidoglycan/LPS O-acetylase OafA/YrhL